MLRVLVVMGVPLCCFARLFCVVLGWGSAVFPGSLLGGWGIYVVVLSGVLGVFCGLLTCGMVGLVVFSGTMLWLI